MSTQATILHADLDAFYASVEQLLDPEPARQADRRRRRRGPRGVLRGQGVRRPGRHVRARGARAVPRARLRRRPLRRVPAPRRRGHRHPRRLHAARGADLDRRSLRRRQGLHAPLRHARPRSPRRSATAFATELGLPISVGVARTKHLAKIASQVAKPDGLVVVDPATELEFLHDLPVGLMWGVGPVTRARLAEQGIFTIGQLASTRAASLERLLGHAAGREARTRSPGTAIRARFAPRHAPDPPARSPRSDGSPRSRQVFVPALRHLADRVASRLRAKVARRPDRHRARALRRHARRHAVGHARRADLRDDDPRRDRRGPGARRARRPSARSGSSPSWPSRSPTSARSRSCSSSCRSGFRTSIVGPGSRQGAARWSADRAMDAIRARFGRDAIG